MKYQNLFSRKSMKNISVCRLLKILPSQSLLFSFFCVVMYFQKIPISEYFDIPFKF